MKIKISIKTKIGKSIIKYTNNLTYIVWNHVVHDSGSV